MLRSRQVKENPWRGSCWMSRIWNSVTKTGSSFCFSAFTRGRYSVWHLLKTDVCSFVKLSTVTPCSMLRHLDGNRINGTGQAVKEYCELRSDAHCWLLRIGTRCKIDSGRYVQAHFGNAERCILTRAEIHVI